MMYGLVNKACMKMDKLDKVIQILKNNNYLCQKEGATWFVSTALGDDKDNVVIRSDGTALILQQILLIIITSLLNAV